MSTARTAARPALARRASAALFFAAGGFAATAPAADRCTTPGGCPPQGSNVSAYGCEDESCFDSVSRRFREWSRVTRAGLRMKSEGHLREHALEHPQCPPYAAPAWGYHQTCWRQFPEQEIRPCPPYHPTAGHPTAGHPASHGAAHGVAPPAPSPYQTELAAPMQPTPAPLPSEVDLPAHAGPPTLESIDAPNAPAPLDPSGAPEATPEPSEPSVPRTDDPFADPTPPGEDLLGEDEVIVLPRSPIQRVSAEIPVIEIPEPTAILPPPPSTTGRASLDEAQAPTSSYWF